MTKGIVIFTGYNTRAVIAFCRFLKLQGLKAHLIAKNLEDPIFFTDYRDWVHSTRKSNVLEINCCMEYFEAIKEDFNYQSLMLAPTSEFLNRFFLLNKDIFKKQMVNIPLVDIDLYRLISNKFSFRNLCRDHGLDIPRPVDQTSNKFPFVAKRKVYETNSSKQTKPYLIFNDLDYNTFCKNEEESDFYFESFIEGESYYLLYYISGEGVVTSLSQRNLIQQDNGKSIIAARPSDIHESGIGKQYGDLFISLGFSGLIMVEVRKHKDRYIMIEANPRFWGPLQFVVDNKPAMLSSFLLDQDISINRNVNDIDSEKKYCSYFWYGGYILDKADGNSPTFHQYESSVFYDELPGWMSADVLLREDSLQLFKSEIKGQISS